MIDEKAVVACYVDAAAILAMVVLLLQSGHLRKQNNLSMRVFYALSWQVLFTAVACFVFYAMYRQAAPWCHTVAWISRTLWDYSVLAVDFLWLTYVDVKLFGTKKRGTLTRIVRILPLLVFMILLVINLFTGILFTIAEDNSLQPKPLFNLMTLTMFLYFCMSALFVWYFDRKKNKGTVPPYRNYDDLRGCCSDSTVYHFLRNGYPRLCNRHYSAVFFHGRRIQLSGRGIPALQ